MCSGVLRDIGAKVSSIFEGKLVFCLFLLVVLCCFGCGGGFGFFSA